MLRHFSLWVAAAVWASAATGCSSAGADARESVENTGSIGLELVAGGVTLADVAYTITGPNGYAASGSIDAQNSTKISSLIGGIPVGSGYTITLSAQDVFHPETVCSGSATFDIVANATTSAQVHLTCRVPPTTGSVLVKGSINVCPTLTSFSIDPLEIIVGPGHPIKLAARATDGDNGPNALSFTYTATSGMLFNAQTAFAVLECTAPGPVTITLTVSDGDPACDVTASQVVTCTPAPGGGG